MSTDYLTVSANGDTIQIPYFWPASGDHYDKVDDSVGSPDDATTDLFSDSTSYCLDLFALTDLSLDGTINWIKVWVRCAGDQYLSQKAYAKTAIKTGGTVYYGSEINLIVSWTSYSTQYVTNPNTGSAWEWDELNSLQAGVTLKAYSASIKPYCTQVYVEVDYTEPTGWQGKIWGVTNPSKIMGVSMENIAKVGMVE